MKAQKDNTYLNIRTESVANKVILELENYSNEEVEIDKIVGNTFNLNINIFRILIIFFIIFWAEKIKNNSVYNLNYDRNSKRHKFIYYAVIGIIIGVVIIYCKNMLFLEENSIIREDVGKDNMLRQAQALLSGQVSFFIKPSDNLNNLSNVYDKSLRESNLIFYLWDVTYYNGNYYNYFTILPTIFLVMPFRLITGYWLTTAFVNTLLLCLTLVLISILFKKLVDIYIYEIKLFDLVLGELTVIIGSNVLLLIRGMNYEIAELCGIIFLILTILIIISIHESEKYMYLKLVACGITTAFIVISKPTFIAWYIFIFLILFKILCSKNRQIKSLIKKVVIYFIPIIIIAIFQMWYNYIRYDNIFEFGAKYQLTIYDMKQLMTVSVPRLMAGMIKYIFSMPVISMENFPFVTMREFESQITTPFGVLFFELPVLGLISIPINYFLLLKKKILKADDDKKQKELSSISNIVLGITFIIIILNISFAGLSEQYAIQYKVMIAMISTIIGLKSIENNKISHKTFLCICIISILIVLPISFNTLSDWLLQNTNEFVVSLKNLFEFWN